MNLPVRVQSVADAEFTEGAVWYYQRSERVAEAFISAVEGTFARIGESPDAFPLVFRSFRAARVPGFPYTVYFTIREDGCVVHAVHHGKRSPRRWMRRGAG